MIVESGTYLADELFDDAGELFRKYYQDILESGLWKVSTNEADRPQQQKQRIFYDWLSVEVSARSLIRRKQTWAAQHLNR